MNGKLVGYWLSTRLVCLAMGAASVLNLIRFGGRQESMKALGLPACFPPVVEIAGVLGGVAILTPKTPLTLEIES